MAVQFILGASGAGKTEYLYQTAIRFAKEHRDMMCYFLVPEQFTLQTQKDLAKRHPAGGIINIDVISLARLSHKVFEELGGEQRTVLKDIGKSMVVKRILNECADGLSLFSANAGQSGFVEEVKSLLSELYQYGIGEEQLNEMIEKNSDSPLLCKKLNDVLILFRAFQKFLGERYMTSEGIYDVLAECVEQSKLLKNCVIIMDGFTGFTPSQYALLKKLMQQAKTVYLALTLEEGAYRRMQNGRMPHAHELFYMSCRSLYQVKELAKEAGCEVLPPVFPTPDETRFQAGSVLHHLERTLFRYPVQPMEQKEFQSSEELVLFAAKNPVLECRFAATEAARLVREEGYRYRDIAVICSDITAYGECLMQEFERAGLPAFLDYKKNMSENLCADYVRAVLKIAEQGMTTENVMSYLKNVLSGWQAEEVWALENYCLAVGIKGWQFLREWKKTYRTHTEVDLKTINGLRERVVNELTPILTLFQNKNATVREWTTGFFYFLKERGVEQKLRAMQEEFLAQGERLRAREYAQVYRVLLELFDQLVELLGEEKLSAREYRELVETGLHEAKVGLVPTGSEQLVIGDMERTRLKDIKALFFLGVNDGKIPAPGSGRGILSDKDRQQLTKDHIELSPDSKTKACFGQFYLYMNMTKPKERLYLTYAQVGEDGKTIRTSYLIGKVKALFPWLEIRTDYENAAEEILKNDQGRRAFLDGLRQFAAGEAGEEFAPLYRHFSVHATEREKEHLLAAAMARPKEECLLPETAKSLYGEKLLGSVTRLEQYAACAFAHFLKYGLNLEERSEYRLAAPDVGNLYHDALKRFGEEMLSRGMLWQELSDEERNALVGQCAEAAVEDYANDIFASSAKNAYTAQRVGNTLKKTLEVLTKQLNGSEFTPAGFEKEFYHTDRNLSLYGKIDRYDTCEIDGKKYIKIVDYKSGIKDFEPEKLYYGLTMQLAVYMTAATQKFQGTPAAMFYYHIDNPIVDKSDTPELEVLKKLRVKGLVNEKTEVIQKLDHAFLDAAGGLAASVKSFRIPVETDKEGKLKKSSRVADTNRFTRISEFVYEKLSKEGEQILEGDVRIAPYKLGDSNACEYCSYAAVCGFDKRNGSSYRILKRKSDEEVWSELENRENE
ncbi:MAG: PD-(D/E)XK nuclease family protein [Lachnospiraceae bacterium]